MAFLVKAKSEGFFTPERVAHLKRDPDFNSIRTLPKFIQFLAELEDAK